MYIVGRKSNTRGIAFAGQSTQGRPTTFRTEDEAAAEASRRATQKPGQEWHVFGVIGTATEPVRTTYTRAER